MREVGPGRFRDCPGVDGHRKPLLKPLVKAGDLKTATVGFTSIYGVSSRQQNKSMTLEHLRPMRKRLIFFYSDSMITAASL